MLQYKADIYAQRNQAENNSQPYVIPPDFCVPFGLVRHYIGL